MRRYLMIKFGEITFKTVDNGDYEDLTREEKIEFQHCWRMFAVEELIRQGTWLIVPRDDGSFWGRV
jgi:hypothetical protein